MAVGNRLGRRRLVLAVTAGALGLYSGKSLQAAATNYYWDPNALLASPGSGGSGTWNTTANDWFVTGSADSVYSSSTTATAAIFAGNSGSVSLSSNLSAFSVAFNTAGYTINGTSTLTVGAGGIVSNTSGGTTTFNNPITVGGTQGWIAGTATTPDTMIFTGNIADGANGLTTGGSTGTTGFGTYNFSGSTFSTSNKVTFDGTVNWAVTTATIGGQPEGIGSGQSGTFNMTAGTTTITPGAGYYLFIGNGAVGALNISGGTLNLSTGSGLLLGDGYNNTGAAGTGTLTVSGTGTFNTGTVTGTFSLGNVGIGVGEVDLNGGTISTLRTISKGSGGTGTAGTAVFNFNGGTLQATGTTLAMSGLTRANVRSGGAIINTNGFNVTIAQSLLHTNLTADMSLTTDGGFIKNGTGVLTLTGTNAWYGATTVNGGTLKAGSILAFPSTTVATGSGALAVGAAGTLDLGGQYLAASQTSGGGLSAASLNLASGGTLNFDINAGSADQLTITGSATSAGGNISIGASGTSITPGSFTLATAASGDLSGFSLVNSRVNSGGLVYPLSLTAATGSDILTIGSGQVTSYYFTGSIDGNFNTLSGGNSNFATTAAGTTNTMSLPGSLADVYLTANSSSTTTTTLGQDFTINTLTFTGTNTSGGASSVSVGGSNTLTLLAASGAYASGVGIVVNSGAAADTISANLALGSSQSLNNSSANLFTVSGNVNNAGYRLTILGAGSTAISGTISGSGGVTDSATGVLALSGSNTYTGATTVTSGTLNATSFGTGGSPSALGASTNTATNLILAGATLQYNGAVGVVTDRLFTIGIAGGANTATIDASGTGTGVDFTNTGSIAFNNTAAHTLTLTGTSAGANIFSPAISDQSTGSSTSVVKSGTGTWQLNGSSTYTGGTSINGGNLLVSSSSALGTGAVTDNGAGSTVLAGTLQVEGGITITNTMKGLGARNDPASSTSAPQIENVSENNTITGLLDDSAAGGLGILIKSDSGVLALSGGFENTSGSTYARPFFFYGAGNGVESGMASDADAGTGTSTNGVAITVEGPGTWTFTAASNFSGGTTITGGTLQLGDGTSGHDGTFANTSSIVDNATLAYDRFGSVSSSRNISGSGVVTMSGTGTQTLTGINTYTGGSVVNSGTLTFAGPAAFPVDSPLNIASGAIATAADHGTNPKNNLFTSQLTLGATGTLDLNNNDLLVQNGNLQTITGEVAIAFASGARNGYGITSTSAANDTTHLTTLGVIQNSSDGVTNTGSALYQNFDGITNGMSSDVLVKYTYFGDANLDGEVDGSDYTLIDNGFNDHLTGWYNGDFNYDGVVDGSDYTLIDNAFNTQGAQIAAEVATATDQIASAGTSAVPEPASLGLIGLGLAGLLGRRRRTM